jgi:signal peptidase I
MIREASLHSAGCDLVAEVVRATGSATLKVTGLSMLPAIWPGDVLTVSRVSPKLIEPDQVVLYRHNGKFTAHRVVEVAHDHFLTRGDCVPSLDPPVTFSAMVGQVIAVSRNGRAVKFQPSAWQRTAAWFLRHSELSVRLLLHFRAAPRHLTEIPEKQIL